MHGLKLAILYLCLATINLCASDVIKIKEELVKLAAEIQSFEVKKLKITDKIRNVRTHESKQSEALCVAQQDILNTLKQARSEFKISPVVLSIMNGGNLKEALHTSMLLKARSPKTQGCGQKIKNVASNLAQICKQADNLNQTMKEIEDRYKILNDKQNHLIEKKYKVSFGKIEKPSADKNVSFKNFNDTVQHVMSMFEQGSRKDDLPLLLIKPVCGDMKKKSSTTMSFKTFPDMQVVSPVVGRIVFIGQLEERGHVVILKHGQFFIVLKGIEVPICQLGENMLAGEPIGKAVLPGQDGLLNTNLSSKHEILLELRKEDTILDPSPYIRQEVEGNAA